MTRSGRAGEVPASGPQGGGSSPEPTEWEGAHHCSPPPRSAFKATGRAVFAVTIMDVSDPASVRAALASLDEPVDDPVENAGGSGGKTPLALTRNGVTEIFASNVLGHVVLLDGPIAAGKLKRATVFAGSEAARGVPKLGMKRPVLANSSADEFASLCDGS